MSKINYDLQKIRAIAFDIDGVLSPSVVPLSANGTPQRMANLKDGYSMVRAVKAGIRLVIVSGADCPGLRERFKLIGLADDDIYLSVSDKLPVLQDWAQRNGISPDEIAYAGDDVPDLAPMQWVGLSVSPKDGAYECKEIATFVSSANGGYGVAREIVEEIMRAQKTWPTSAGATGI